jgi:GT2 family glycosyltransferase
VIVVDQAPSAEASEAAAGVGPELAVRYVSQERRGTSASRNLILELTTTPVLAMTDDDCLPEPGWLAAIASALEADQELTGIAGPVLAALGPRPPRARAASLRPSLVAATYRGRPLPWLVGSGGNFAVKTDLLRQVGGWDERLGPGTPGRAAEDIEIIDRLMSAGAVIRYEPAAIVHHDWHPAANRGRARWNYRVGLGAVVGMRLGRGDRFGLRMLRGYVRMSLGIPDDVQDLVERTWTLGGLVPGLRYGWRCERRGADHR